MNKISIFDNTILYHLRAIENDMNPSLWDKLTQVDHSEYLTLNSLHRKKEWCEVRRAKLNLTSSIDSTTEISSYSLSHCWANDNGMAAAAILLKKNNHTTNAHHQIGLDIEHNNRKIDNFLIPYFCDSFEQMLFDNDVLSIWTIKEACLKAHPFKIENFQTYKIKDHDKNLQQGIVSITNSDLCFKYKIVKDQNCTIALAVNDH